MSSEQAVDLHIKDATTGRRQAAGVRTIAVFEAVKGVLVLLAGCGLLSLVHRDAELLAERLVRRMHLNPARHYPRIFIEAAAHVNDRGLRMFALLALAYSTVRFIEAYGLWRMRAWAEWFAIVSGAIYLPLEIYELTKHATPIRALVLVVNAFIVAYMLRVRMAAHRESTAHKAVERTLDAAS